MPSERSSAGDPARTLALLWRDHSDAAPTGQSGRRGPRGPRQGRTVDQVVDAAIDLADAEGIDALTMRRVAGQLGIAPMSLYTYVPGKAELLDLMLDTVYARMDRHQATSRGWRARVRAVARDNLDLCERHPWVAEVSTSRPPLGPGLMAKYEHELQAFEGLGLSDVDMDAALTHVLGFVQASARAAADAAATAEATAMNDEEWWAANEPLLTRVLDETTYPTAGRVGSAAGAAQGGAFDAARAYEFGLALVLDGLAALIDRRRRR